MVLLSMMCMVVRPASGCGLENNDESSRRIDLQTSSSEKKAYSVKEGNVLTLYYDENMQARGGRAVETGLTEESSKNDIARIIIDPSYVDYTPNSLERYFEGFSNLASIEGMQYFNTSKATSMYGLFAGCSSLISLDLNSFDTQNVTGMAYMFGDCTSLASLDLSNFNTKNVRNMNYMFHNCPSLASLDLSSFDTRNVEGMSYMFDHCSSLTSLDLSSFDTRNVTGMFEMFSKCTSLRTIYAGEYWSTEKIEDEQSGKYMFWECSSLVGGEGTRFDDSEYNHTYAHVDEGPDNPGYLTWKSNGDLYFTYRGKELRDGATVTIAAGRDEWGSGEMNCVTNLSSNPGNGLVLVTGKAGLSCTARMEILNNTLGAGTIQWCMGGECMAMNGVTMFEKTFTSGNDRMVQVQFDAINIINNKDGGILEARLTVFAGDKAQTVNIKFTYEGENKMWWGYYSDADAESINNNIGGKAGTIDVGIWVTASQPFVRNKSLTALRIWLGKDVAAISDDVKIWISKTLPTDISACEYVQTVPVSSLMQGKNEIKLTTPFVFNNTGILVGYTFTISKKAYPVMSGGDDAANAFWYRSGDQWKDFKSYGYGKLGIQLLLEGDGFPNNQATPTDFKPAVVESGKSVYIPIKITNGGKDPITCIAYTLSSNGSDSSEQMVQTGSIPYGTTAKVNVKFDADTHVGKANKTLTITKVNGYPNTAQKKTATGALTTVAILKTWPRNVLIEEFTTESCVYCPEAAKGLAAFLDSNPDKVDRVALACHHAGFYTDWLTVAASESYTWFYNSRSTYAPAFMYDRFAWDKNSPVVGRGDYQQYVDARIAEPSYVGITLSADVDSSKEKINVTVSCERGWDFSTTPARITLFLTEDNITAESQAGSADTFIHQHVLRDVNKTWGNVLNFSDDKAIYNYTFNLDPSWKIDDLKVVAFVSGYDDKDATNCTVENVATVALGQSASAVDEVVADNRIIQVSYYDLSGQKVNKPSKGVYVQIVKYADGRTLTHKMVYK